jgi:glycosyltransferase involved in cell wall biosynthesis
VVEEGRTGLLVPAGDAAALGRALARLVTDGALRARLGHAAGASVLPRFGVETYVDAVVSLYDKLLLERAA